MRRQFFPHPVLWIGLAALWLAGNTLLVLSEAKAPGTDVFLFKEAGINLAQQGRFIASNLPHQAADQPAVYAYYPPLYPLAYGLFTKLAGVGLKQSLIFDSALRALRTILLLLFLWPMLVATRRDRVPGVDWCLLGAAVFSISLLSTDSDRPDELAIAWGLAAWYTCRKTREAGRWLFLAAGCLGLCGATSLAAGVFFALGSGIDLLRRARRKRTLVAYGLGALLAFLACTYPLHAGEAGSLDRFFAQVPFSTFPYLAPLSQGGHLTDVIAMIRYCLSQLWSVGKPYCFALFLLTLINVWLRHQPKHEAIPESLPPFLGAGVLFIPFSVLVWSLQPYYFWFSLVCLFTAALGESFQVRHRWQRVAGLVGCLAALIPLLIREAKFDFNALQRPEVETAESIRAHVLARLSETDRLAVSPDQYFTFRPERAIDNVTYVCDRLEKYQYVYVTPMASSLRSRPVLQSIPCPDKQHCFTVAEDLTSRTVLTIAGRQTPYFVRGNGGVLYRNTQCRNGAER